MRQRRGGARRDEAGRDGMRQGEVTEVTGEVDKSRVTRNRAGMRRSQAKGGGMTSTNIVIILSFSSHLSDKSHSGNHMTDFHVYIYISITSIKLDNYTILNLLSSRGDPAYA